MYDKDDKLLEEGQWANGRLITWLNIFTLYLFVNILNMHKVVFFIIIFALYFIK